MQRTGDAAAEQRQCAVQLPVLPIGVENSIHSRGAQQSRARWPRRPNPGHVSARCGPIGPAGTRLRVPLIAPSSRSPSSTIRDAASPRASAARTTPVPSGFVRMSRSPGRRPPLRSSSPRPRPPGQGKNREASSAPSALCPPTKHGPCRFEHVEPTAQHVNESCSTMSGRAGGRVAIASAVLGACPPCRRCRRARGRRDPPNRSGRRPWRGRNRRSAAVAATRERDQRGVVGGCRDRS